MLVFLLPKNKEPLYGSLFYPSVLLLLRRRAVFHNEYFHRHLVIHPSGLDRFPQVPRHHAMPVLTRHCKSLCLRHIAPHCKRWNARFLRHRIVIQSFR